MADYTDTGKWDNYQSFDSRAGDNKAKKVVDEKNLYEPHPWMIHSGLFWRCNHGSTGYYACIPCGRKHPAEFVKHLAELIGKDESQKKDVWECIINV